MASNSPSRRPLKKRLLFSLVALLLCYALLEGAALLLFVLSFEGGFSPQRLDEQRQELLARRALEQGPKHRKAFIDNRVFHPYMGHVNLPKHPVTFESDTPVARLFDDKCRTNSHGYFGPEPGARAPGTFQVVITGGSVANLIYCYSRAALAAELRQIPALASKKLVFTGLAFCGFRQPQQLMALSYLAAQGVQPDLLINLDGFNEVGTHELSDEDRNQDVVYPQYPHLWSQYFRIDSPAALQAVGLISLYMERRVSWAEATSGLDFSVLGYLTWAVGDRTLAALANRQREQLKHHQDLAEGYSFQVYGPRSRFPDRKALARFNARTWYNASAQLARMARAGGYRYVHFLQPNLHLSGSKTLTPPERQMMKNGRQLAEAAVEGYPLLRAYAPALRKAGVRFHDLTRVFAGEASTVAADDCCHFTRAGDAIIARAMGRLIRQGWAEQ